ncbi:MAG: o-succinylbenzoate synthase [Odoribacteraceae bacterium]|jgi:o-succinylbenzoate synthase|nr:o-succinylbenzoate synthase [Odoribacteraceae bacterium]
MLEAFHAKYLLRFNEPAVTSRGVMTVKECHYVLVRERGVPGRFGIGEVPLFPGLSAEDCPGHDARLDEACARVNDFRPEAWRAWSSICFGMETALADLRNGGQRLPFPSAFTRGEQAIEINGLVWMGNREQMARRVDEKLAAGFRCLKLKIGGIDFEEERALLREIRARYPAATLQLRLDANGAFSPREAPRKLEQLAAYDIHSIEQPIRQGQWRAMCAVAVASPIPVALDEELIGVTSRDERQALLDTIAPRYIILKPSLAGGFQSCDEWIALAGERAIGWWVTSALESNVGLNAIAQWCAPRVGNLPQGLGTGQLYANNIPSPLLQCGVTLVHDPRGTWHLATLFPPLP